VAFEQWAVVVVPFPFTDRDTQMRRPAVVLSSQMKFGAPSGHSVLAMITNASHSGWPFDVVLTDRVAAGLPAPSMVRMKLFTIDDRLVLRRLGRLAPPDQEAVTRAIDGLLDRS
jgi:mRNA interferase MazF